MTSPFSEDRLMSISAQEFEASIVRMGAHRVDGAGAKVFVLASGEATITFVEVEGVRLGKLLALPRARVKLNFTESVSIEDRADFTRRFDIAFQRGGG